MFCRKCGNQLQDDWVACPKCGEGSGSLSEADKKRIAEEEKIRIAEQKKQPKETEALAGCLMFPIRVIAGIIAIIIILSFFVGK